MTLRESAFTRFAPFLLVFLVLPLLLMVALPNAGSASTPGSQSLLEMRVPGSPVVAIRVLVEAGSMDDPSGKEGICRLTMAAAAEGGTPSLTKDEVVNRFYPMDASIELFTDREATAFTARVRREDLAEFFPIFWDLLFHPRFDPEDFRQQKERALSSLRNDLREGDDEELGKEGLQAFLFEKTAYAHPAIGTETGLQSLSIEDLKAFHQAVMTHDRVRVGIAGDYDEAFAQALKHKLEAIPGGTPQPDLSDANPGSDRHGTAPPSPTAFAAAANRPVIQPPHFSEIEALLIEKPAQATAISLGFPYTVRRGDPDYWPLYLALNAFGEHRTFLGRLMREMRSDRGLNYGDYAYIEQFDQDGWSRYARPGLWRSAPHFSIWVRPVQPANGVFALRMAVWELQNLIDRGLSPEEFETTREHLRNLSQLWQQTLARRIGLAMDDAHFGEADGIESLRQALETMTVEQVNDALKRRLTSKDLKVAMVCAQADSIRGLLLSGKPTPIVYSGGDAPDAVKATDTEIAAMPLAIKEVRIKKAEEMFR